MMAALIARPFSDPMGAHDSCEIAARYFNLKAL
jgi:hypothetical protein